MVLYLSETDIAKVLSYEKLIPAMERALAEFSAGKVISLSGKYSRSRWASVSLALCRR